MQSRILERGRLDRPAARNCRSQCGLFAILLLGLTGLAQGIEMPGLYTVEVPFDSSQRNAETEAQRIALAEVIVRITGTTAAAESAEMASLFPQPGRFVRQFRFGSNDTMIISMDGEAIGRVLRQAGAPVWGSDRPLTLVWLAVDWGMGEREIIAADDPVRMPGDARSIDRNQLLRERVQAVATRRGIPVAFPLLDTEDLQNVSFSDIWGGFDERLLAASARYQATSVLIGRIRTEDLQPQRWTWFFGDQRRVDWAGEPEEAVGILADALAREFVIDPNQSIDRIHLTVSGIDSVVAYGRVQRAMEGLRIVDKLMVTSVSSDRISYEIEIQGGAERLRGALASSGILVPVESSRYIDASSFRRDDNRADSGMGVRSEMTTMEYLYRSRDD